VRWYSRRSPGTGNVKVYIDGILQDTVNLHKSWPEQNDYLAFELTNIPYGAHTLELKGAYHPLDIINVYTLLPVVGFEYLLSGISDKGNVQINVTENEIIDIEFSTQNESPSAAAEYELSFSMSDFWIYDLCGFTSGKITTVPITPYLIPGTDVTIIDITDNSATQTIRFSCGAQSGNMIKQVRNIVRLKAKRTDTLKFLWKRIS